MAKADDELVFTAPSGFSLAAEVSGECRHRSSTFEPLQILEILEDYRDHIGFSWFKDIFPIMENRMNKKWNMTWKRAFAYVGVCGLT